MNKVENKYKFSMSYGDLYSSSRKAILMARRDINDLQRYGITSAWLDDFRAMIDDFRETETDEEILGDQRIATKKRDTYRDGLHIEIVAIMVRVKLLYGLRSHEYQRFGTKGMSRMNDNDFACMARKVCAEATVLLPQLATKNVTAADIANLQAMESHFTGLIDAQIRATAERDARTQARIAEANLVYDHLVELTSVGKTHYFSRDAARYNDYLIYG